MTVDEAIAVYAGKTPAEQLRILVRYAHWVTIIARGTYVGGSDEVADPRRLRVLNEIQHRVLGFISSLAEGKRPWCDDKLVVPAGIDEDDPVLLDAFGRAIRESL